MKKVLILNNQEIEYELRYSLKKGIKLSFHSDRNPQLVLSTSSFTTQKEIDSFLNSHQRWITNRINKGKDNKFYLLGKEYQLVKEKSNVNKIKVLDDKVVIYQKEDNRLIEEVLIKKLWKKILIDYIDKNIERYQRVTGKKYVEFTYRYMTSRYGSCKSKENKITLNTQLARYSPELIDSVVFHEYAHFVVGNHSSNFYKVLSNYDSDYLRHRKELISYALYSFGKD